MVGTPQSADDEPMRTAATRAPSDVGRVRAVALHELRAVLCSACALLATTVAAGESYLIAAHEGCQPAGRSVVLPCPGPWPLTDALVDLLFERGQIVFDTRAVDIALLRAPDLEELTAEAVRARADALIILDATAEWSTGDSGGATLNVRMALTRLQSKAQLSADLSRILDPGSVYARVAAASAPELVGALWDEVAVINDARDADAQ